MLTNKNKKKKQKKENTTQHAIITRTKQYKVF